MLFEKGKQIRTACLCFMFRRITMKKIELQYALAKQIPAARFKMNIQTDYGDIQLWEDDANFMADRLEDLLEHKLIIGEYEEDT
jgi:hypothetical protein